MLAQPPTKKRPFWLILLGIFALLCILLAVIGSFLPQTPAASTNTPAPTQTPIPPTATPDPIQLYLDQYGGNIEVYRRIFSFTDCASLQDEFDQASANNYAAQPGTDKFKWTTGYMLAADERMKSIECY